MIVQVVSTFIWSWLVKLSEEHKNIYSAHKAKQVIKKAYTHKMFQMREELDPRNQVHIGFSLRKSNPSDNNIQKKKELIENNNCQLSWYKNSILDKKEKSENQDNIQIEEVICVARCLVH